MWRFMYVISGNNRVSSVKSLEPLILQHNVHYRSKYIYMFEMQIFGALTLFEKFNPLK